YVSGMIGGGQEKTPTVSLTPDNTNSRARIASADPNILWSNFQIQASEQVNASHSLDDDQVDILTTATSIGDLWSVGPGDTVTAGDYIQLHHLDSGESGSVTITLIYRPTNAIAGSVTVFVPAP
ncbi:MAG: hypothetical protein R6V50_00005, partial [Thermoplasmatota archaeon]